MSVSICIPPYNPSISSLTSLPSSHCLLKTSIPPSSSILVRSHITYPHFLKSPLIYFPHKLHHVPFHITVHANGGCAAACEGYSPPTVSPLNGCASRFFCLRSRAEACERRGDGRREVRRLVWDWRRRADSKR